MAHSEANTDRFDAAEVTRQHWRWAVLASMASYIDAGSIVAGATGLSGWAQAYGMSGTTVGLLGAFSSNAISTGIGALLGGWLGDILGRKRIYTYDLLLYAFGVLWIIFSANVPMLFIGYILVGLAVGADIPVSWSLIGEFAPSGARGKLMGMTNMLWYIGPIVTLVLALVFTPLGLLGTRLVFAHLFVVAIVTWLFRRGMLESSRWEAARDEADAQMEQTQGTINPFARSRLRDLLAGPNMKALLFITSLYLFWNLVAGTYGFFYPYILTTIGNTSQAASVGMQSLWFISAIIAVALIFMPFNDRANRRVMYGISAALQVIAFFLFVFYPLNGTAGLNITVALANVLLFGFGHGIAQWPLLQVWAVELFPTMIRNTAQGLMLGVSRIGLGIWSIFVPGIAAAGFSTFALILALMLTYTLIVGTIFAPKTGGLTLEQIQEQRAGRRAAA